MASRKTLFLGYLLIGKEISKFLSCQFFGVSNPKENALTTWKRGV
jgi:hypothetical protein